MKTKSKFLNILLVILLTVGMFTFNSVVRAEETFTTKYAVQIYGIEQDTLEDGSTAGLTFGPALGQDFINTYISHIPSGTSASGNPHRCIHDDNWETIIEWNNEDPYVYEQCISNNCTHSVELTFPDYLKNTSFVYGGSSLGDGVGTLYYEFNGTRHRSWNPINKNTSYGTNEGGWGASRIRAMMNGYDELTMLKGSYSYYNSSFERVPETNYTSGSTLIDAFPQILQDNIGARKTLYDSVYNSQTETNLKTSYDKLWLLSPNEMADSISLVGYKHPLEAPNGKYSKFVENNINLSGTHNTAFRAYRQIGINGTSGTGNSWWLRSSYGERASGVLAVDSSAHANNYNAYNGYSISPCFSLGRSYVPSYDPTDPNYDPTLDNGHYVSKRGINTNNDWIKNGNTWTYTFDVFDDSIPYYIWEDKISGYTSSVMKPNKDLMNQNGEKYYEIINRSTTLGSLNITKTTNNETEDRFEFTITLNGNGLEGTKVFSNVIFTDGVGKIKLGKNESKLIEGLPAGITYTVEENHYSDYTTTSTGATGTIVQGETQEASFNNVLKHVEDYTIETGFKVKKVVDGNNEIDETFDFIAQINTGEPNKRIILSNGETLTSDASGLIIYEFSLANNEELLFSNLSTGSTYQVTEKAGEYISSYNIVDANDVGSITQSANENTAQNLALTTAVETLDEDERVEITFTNKIIKKQNLKVAKQVNGNAEDKAKQYEITVELYGLDPMATLDSDAGRFVADEDGYAIKTILLRDGEEFMIPEVPVGTQYVIAESPNNTYAAYEIIDANGGSNFVNKIDFNNDINLRLATQMETVNENEEATVKFTNTSQVTLKLEKVVDGNMGNKEDEFEFDVKVWKDAPDIEYINLSNYGGVSQGNGIYRFTLKHGDNIDIIKAFPGYSYEITEVDYSNEGYRTYPNDSMIQGRTISGVLNANAHTKMRNIRGAAVPTEIRFWWWAGIPLVLGPIAWFVFRKRKQHID